MQNLGKLLLRLTVGGLLIFHGINKITEGVGFIEGLLKAKGLPEAMAYGAYVGEVAAPALVIVGFFTRISALVIAGNMAFAIFLAHQADLTKLNNHGAWAVELPMFYLLTALCIFLLGPGRYSIDGRKPKPE